MIKVLFVCLGNICRSPMAEMVFKDFVKNMGYEKSFFINSAGTEGYNELCQAGIHFGTKEMLKKMHIPFEEHISHQLRAHEYFDYDYIIVMDRDNLKDVKRIVNNPPDFDQKVFRFLDFSPNKRDIRDPWYTGNFDETYWDIVEGCDSFFNYLIKEHKNEDF